MRRYMKPHGIRQGMMEPQAMYEPQGLARIWLRFRSYWKLWPYAY